MALTEMLQSRGLEPSPVVVSPLSPELRRALIGLLTCSLLSVIATSTLLIWLTYRLIFWRRYYSRYIGYNQCIVLIFNLLLADLQQSSSFLVTPYWLQTNQLSAHSNACFVQAWLINFGDISSGLFVLSIAAHTFAVVVNRKLLGYKTFIGCIVAVWVFCVIITLIAPALYGSGVFVPAGGWCWIDRQYEQERLYLHYIWIFISEFGSVALYAALYIVLRRRLLLSSSLGQTQDQSAQKFSKVIRYMLLYPIAYIILSLPIAAGRISLMNGKDPGETYFYASGCIIMCSGWVDSIIYFITRRRLIEADVNTESGGMSSSNRMHYGNRKNSITGGVGMGSKIMAEPLAEHDSNSDTVPIRGGNQWHISNSESTDRIIEPVELSDLGHVQQTTVIEVTSEPAVKTTSPPSTTSSSTLTSPDYKVSSGPQSPIRSGRMSAAGNVVFER